MKNKSVLQSNSQPGFLAKICNISTKERATTSGRNQQAKNGRFLVVLGLLMILFAATGCGGNGSDPALSQSEELTPVTVTLDWTPNTNHTGLYVAAELGYYKEAGLDVTIVQPAGGTAEQLVAADQAQFGISYQEGVTYARSGGIPVVSIAAVIQNNTSGFASLAEKQIETPADFAGKRYGGWGSPIEEATIAALMKDYQADIADVEILTTGAIDFFALSEKSADFSWIFYGWDGIAAEIRGIELNYIDLGTYNEIFNYYTPVLITSEMMIAQNSDLVQSFMEATIRGYQFAMDNPQKAADVLLAAAPELDPDLVRASQEWLAPRYQDQAQVWGLQDETVWQRYTDWLVEQGLLDQPIDVSEAFTNQFLQ